MPSSVIATFSYDPGTHTLRVVFLSGMIYDYLDVPENVYLDMKSSRSKGIFLNKHIKGHFPFRKIETE